MKMGLLATVAIVAFSAPSFAAETAKPVGQEPPSFYLAQDTATMKCQIVETRPVAGSRMQVGDSPTCQLTSTHRTARCGPACRVGYRHHSLDKGISRDGFDG
jgi:hypothetical protein